MKWINAEQQVTVTIYDEEHEEHLVKTMTVEEMLDTYANEGCPTIYSNPERKTGKWLDAVLPNDNGGLPVQVCDQCNTFFPLAYTGGGHHFCPNCGADMRGEQDENR